MAAQQVMTITLRGIDYRLAIGNVPIAEKMIVRKATGLPFEAFLTEGQIGSDSVAVLWWLARRADGEIGLTWTQAANEWPSDLTADDLEVTMEDASGDDPEA
ncbi:hypothetical protein UFOVP209_27 [uncultured Caudovirales phage]|uniref:Uncharacterized protein n=1 Tax=uncultured Caudovirales phage TaxID=2100421 RepID=A0A6J7WRA3_9CAUD|nr:hypothetical protein UFOVP209_27 [uncultured Caudovirales phage]